MDFNAIFGNHPAAALSVRYPFQYHHIYNIFCQANDLEMDTTGTFCFWITYAMAIADRTLTSSAFIDNRVENATVPDVSTGRGMPALYDQQAVFICKGHFYSTEAQIVHGLTSREINDEDAVNLRAFHSARGPCYGIYHELLACWQIKPLTSENIGNYFRMLNSDPVRSRDLMGILKATAPKINMLAPTMANLIAQSPFLKYHTAASSTPALLMKVIGDMGNIALTVFSNDDRRAIVEANTHLYNLNLSRAIPTRVIAIGHAFMSATGSLPDNWWQGKTAKDASVQSEYNAFVKFFKHLTSQMHNTASAEKHKLVPLIMESIPQSLIRGVAYDADRIAEARARFDAKKDELNFATLASINEKRQIAELDLLEVIPDSAKATIDEIYAALESDV